MMFETLKRLYGEGRLFEVGLSKAVTKGWITIEEKIEIMTQ